MAEMSVEELLVKASLLIDKRKFERAITLLTAAIASPASEYASFWMTLAVAYDLTGESSAADEFWRRADHCPDYTDVMYGDQLRDRARTAIARMESEVADRCIQEAERCHAGDPNRLAALMGMRGRWHFAKKEYAEALRCHLEAVRLWRASGEAAYLQWIYNNLFPAACAAYAYAEECIVALIRGKLGRRTLVHVVVACVTPIPVVGWRLAYKLSRR